MNEHVSRRGPVAGRFKRRELQEAYELGYRQEYEHDSFALLSRFEWMLDQAPTVTLGAERLAAMLDGAADALHTLARDRCDDLPALRAFDEPRGQDG
jgi:hypothetical protein